MNDLIRFRLMYCSLISSLVVEYVTVAVLDQRPMYSDVVSMLVKASQSDRE
jgi:hypothetical protein